MFIQLLNQSVESAVWDCKRSINCQANGWSNSWIMIMVLYVCILQRRIKNIIISIIHVETTAGFKPQTLPTTTNTDALGTISTCSVLFRLNYCIIIIIIIPYNFNHRTNILRNHHLPHTTKPVDAPSDLYVEPFNQIFISTNSKRRTQ